MNDPNFRIRNNSEMTFTGTWDHRRLLARRYGIFNNSASVSCEAGASASCTFEDCDRLWWYTSLNDPDLMGAAEVFLDGVHVATVDMSDASAFPEKTTTLAYDSGDLTPGRHTLRLVTAGDARHSIEVDRVVARSTAEGLVLRTVDNRNLAFTHYTCGFADRTLDGATLVASREVGDELELYFFGTVARVYGARGPLGGLCEILLDGESRGTVDTYADTLTADALLFEDSALPDTTLPHRLTVRVLGKAHPRATDRVIALHHFVVEDRPCVLTVMNDLTTRELAVMPTAPTYTDPADWRPVTLPGKAPTGGVTLGAGVWRIAFERNIQYLKDCLAKPRWIDDDPYAFSIWVDFLVASNEGRMLGGMGHTLRWLEVPEFRQGIRDILNDVRRRRDANDDGYLMPYDSRNYKSWEHRPWPETSKGEQKNYDRAMFTKGMLAAGAAGFEEAYTLLRGFYDWFNNATEYLPGMLTDSMAIQGSIAGPLVYHSPIGRPDDLITNMKYYDLDWWMDYLDAGVPEAVFRFTLNRPHNYLLTSVCAYFEQYVATGEEKYLRACRGTWRLYHDYFENVGGGITVCEHFECGPRTHLISNRPNSIQETCGNVFWIDLNHRLHLLEPECETYAAEIEQSLYTILFACQAEDGRIRYFNHMDACKFPELRANTCCEIQATMLFGQLPQYIYTLAEDGVYVDQFAASAIDLAVEGRPYRITMDTRFPYEDSVVLTVSAPAGGRMSLRLRVPSWLEAPVDICLNGDAIATGTPGSYVALDRAWSDGDRVTYRLPMHLRAERYTGQNRVRGFSRYGFSYGPVFMALRGPLNQSCTPSEPFVAVAETPNPDKVADSGDELTVRLAMTAEDFLARLAPAGDLTFTVRGEERYTLVPYWSIQDGTYSCFPAFDQSADE